MPLYRAHYRRHGREHDMTFAATDPQAAEVYARNVLADLVEAPIEQIEEFSSRPYRRQHTLWKESQ